MKLDLQNSYLKDTGPALADILKNQCCFQINNSE